MSIYLVDFENVHSDGLVGVLNLSSKDEVFIFYSEKGKMLTFDLHKKISKASARFDYFKISSGGKNALDYQLSTYLGYLIASKDTDKYYIISKDQGYLHIMNFWKSKKNDIKIELIDSINLSKINIKGIQEEKKKQEKKETVALC